MSDTKTTPDSISLSIIPNGWTLKQLGEHNGVWMCKLWGKNVGDGWHKCVYADGPTPDGAIQSAITKAEKAI